jgi:hypothetical protein
VVTVVNERGRLVGAVSTLKELVEDKKVILAAAASLVQSRETTVTPRFDGLRDRRVTEAAVVPVALKLL